MTENIMNHQLSRWISKLYGKQSGQSLVEFALTLPLVALLLFGIIQYGFIFSAMLTVRNASAVGARYAVVGPPSTANIQSVALGALAPMLTVTNNNATATVSTTTVGSASATGVTVTYNLPLIIPFVVPGKTAGSTLALSATTVMR